MVSGMIMRWACAIAGAVLVLSGCDCGVMNPPVVTCSDTTITFETPAADQAVDSPFDVSFIVKNPDGSAFSFEQAQLSVSGGAAVQATTVVGNRATFIGLSGAAGAQTLVATIGQGTCSKAFAPQTVTVRDACSTAAVTAVSFPQDRSAPLGLLNRAELAPGTSLQVQVDATCVTGVQVRIKRGTVEVGTLTSFSNGRATVTLPGVPASDLERVELFAELVRDGMVLNNAVGNPAASASIQVNRALPSCAITTTGTFGSRDDADTERAGFQLRVTGTMATSASGTLGVNGQTPVGVVPSMSGGVSADFTLTNSGMYTATLTCSDANGNSNTVTGGFSLDFEPPSVVIVSPAIADGGAVAVVTQSPLLVQLSTNAEDGSLAQASRDGTSLGSAVMVVNGMATVAVPFSADGSFTISIRVTDRAGNQTTVSFTVTTALAGCGADFSRPSSCPAFLTPAQLPGGTYTFQTTSKSVCANQPAALFRTDVLADGGMTLPAPAGSATLSAAGVANFAPLTLLSGDYVFRAAVSNVGADAGVSEVVCQVTVDLDGPAITSPLVPGAASFATINAVQDTQAATPGVQRVLSYSARVPVGGRVDVCTTQGVNPVTMVTRPTSPECGTGWFVLQQGVVSPSSGFTYPEGTYELKIVIVGSGLPSAPASPAVALLVDSVRPCVNGISRRLPQDANSDGRLNSAELNGAAPRIEFGLGCGDVSAATLSATTPVVIRDITGGAPGAVRSSTAVLSGSTYTVTLGGSFATETNLDLLAQLTDVAGNQSQFAAMNDPATFTFRVDPVAPTCEIQSPGAGQTTIGIAGVSGGMFPVSVATSADVGTNGVQVTFGTTGPRPLTPSNSTAETSYPVSGTNSYVIAATCIDPSGNSTTATERTVTIDLDAPTCAISAPSAMTYSVNQIATSVAVGGADGQPVTVRSSLQGAPLTTNLVVLAGTAAGNLSYPNGTQTVTAEVRDVAGNLCTATLPNVVVNSTACVLSFTNAFVNASGSWFNRSNTGSLSATAGIIAAVSANSSDCRSGQTVVLQRTVPTAGPAINSTTAGNGDVSFANVAVNDGETWTLTIDNGTGILTVQTFRVGLRVPTATGASLNGQLLTTGANLFFVAPSGNINLEPAAGPPRLTTYFPDGSGATAGAQVNVAVSAVNGTRYGTDNGLVEVRYGANVLTSQPVTAEPFDLPTTGISLPHNTTGGFVVRLTTAAGNTADLVSNPATVDVLAPAAPSVAQSLTSARAATVGLTWSPVFDDGSDASSGGLTGGPVGLTAGYDLRWTTASILSNNSMALVADFFGSSSRQDAVVAWSASAINRSLSVPPINSYFIAVRARDEVGNYSTFEAPSALANSWTTTVLSAPVASSNYGATMAAGPLTGNDTAPELVVAASSRSAIGSVYVYASSALTASQIGCTTGCQELTPSDATPGAFGSDLSNDGNIGDVGAEVLPDLVVAQTWSSGTFGGRVVIYFGTTAATLSTTDSIELRGDTTNRIGLTARIIKDISGDGLDELAIASPFFGTNRGRIFIYRGRTQAAWAALRTATDGVTAVQFVPVSAATADYVIDGPTPVLVTPAGNAFGQNRRGLVSTNDLDGDGRPDVAIPMSRGSINRYRVFGSAAIIASSGASPLDGTAGFRLEISEAVTADNSNTAGVGTATIANADFIGSSAADLITTFPGAGGGGQVLMFSSLLAPTAPTLNPAVTTRLTGPLTWGFSVSAGRIDGDTNTDVVAGTNVASGNFAYAVFQNLGSFETGSIGSNTNFWVSRFDAASITGNANSRLGAVSLLEDLSGDALKDVVLSDFVGGEVRIWR